MKEYLKEQNMRRENHPVSTTLDVGLNNNQLVRDRQSPTGSEDTENGKFWVGLPANYEWCCESNSSVDDPEEFSSEYGLGWDEDNSRNNWTAEIAPAKSSDWQESAKNVSGPRDNKLNAREPTSSLDNIWNNTESRNDNEFNNNEAVLHLIAGDSVNQLDSRKNEEKIFYEKPKLNIQTVTYLYDSALPPTEKCMNYVNSIKVSQSLENLTTPEESELSVVEDNSSVTPLIEESEPKLKNLNLEKKVPAPELVNEWDCCWPTDVEVEVDFEALKLTKSVKETLQFPEIEDIPPTEKCMNYVNSIKVSQSLENVATPEESELSVVEDNSSVTQLIEESEPNLKNLNVEKNSPAPELVNDWDCFWPTDVEVQVDFEVLKLTKSVKETLQFPEIEDIPDSVKSSEISETNQEDIVIDHIDLIREAKELPVVEKSEEKEEGNLISTSSKVTEVLSEKNGDSETFFEGDFEEAPTYAKLEEIDLLSSIGRDIGVDLEKYVQPVPDVVAMESVSVQARSLPGILKEAIRQDTNKLVDQELPDVSSADTRKKEKMARNQARRRQQSHSTSGQNRRSVNGRADHITDNGPGGFDVYNIETAMPKIDLDAIESHLRAAREEERREDERVAEVVEAVAAGREPDSSHRDKEDLLARFNRLLEGDTNVSHQRRNDREEIRRRLAMGPDAEDLRTERGRKPSLQSRLQSGMNLQICFMNETPSDTESPGSENDSSPGSGGLSSMSKLQHSHQLASRPQVLSLPPLRVETSSSAGPLDEADFFARQARLQTEARMALAQAKEMAHMQMEVERQRLKQSPITEMVRSSLEKVGVQLGEDRRRLSRVLLTELNVAQLQVVANDLHARIAMLNEALVEGLLRRDDLHMEQDSMLVDVEDLTRYLGAKQESLKKRPSIREQQQQQQQQRHATGNLTSKFRGGHHQTPAKTSISREKLLNSLANRRAA